MILDNIARALRTQNWLAAGVEFVIVIAGVVIGFQITAWNADRQARAVITSQLSEVRDDLAVDIRSLELTRRASLWRFAAAEYILERSERPGAIDERLDGLLLESDYGAVDQSALPEVEPVDHPLLLSRVNLIRGVTGRRTGYESLVNAGSLRLIENRELRAAIQNYYGGYENLQSNLDAFRDIRAAAIPVLYRHGFSLFSEQDFSRVLEAARVDAEFAAYIRTCRELGFAQLSEAQTREAEARALLALLDAELSA